MTRAASGLCRAQAERGHEVSVATIQLNRELPRIEQLGGVRVHRFRSPELLNRRLVPWAPGLNGFLGRALTEVDVVHLHGHRNGLALTAVRALRRTSGRWVLTTHGTYPSHGQYPLLKRAFDRLGGQGVVDGAAALIAVSESEARDLPRPARVIPNGVLPCGRATQPAPRGRPRLLFVGSDRPQKRAARLRALLEALPEVELRLVGLRSAGWRSSFADGAARVVDLGVLAGDALADAYADCDLLVHPAVGEAFGLVPFEAALAGTAAVVAGGHGCGEWYARAGGCVVPPDDDLALAAAVRARLAEPKLARQEASAVAAFVKSQLSWERAAEATEALYRELQTGRA